MSHSGGAARPEIGVLVADSIRDFVKKATARSNISTYAEAVTLRDLVEIAKVWGESCIQLPFIMTVMAKRHSVAARESAGPVTVAVQTPTLPNGTAYIPFGQMPGITIAMDLGAGEDVLATVPKGSVGDLGLTLRGVEGVAQSSFSAVCGARVRRRLGGRSHRGTTAS